MATTADEASSSLIQPDDLVETVHREHFEEDHHPQNRRHNHRHLHEHHNHLHHRRQQQEGDTAAAAPSPDSSTVTVQTVSVVQHVAVDSNGQTLTVSCTTFTATAAGSSVPPAPPTTTPAEVPSQPGPVLPPTNIPTNILDQIVPTPTILPAPSSQTDLPIYASLTAVNGTAPFNSSAAISSCLSCNSTATSSHTLNTKASKSAHNLLSTITPSSPYTTSSTYPLTSTILPIAGAGSGNGGTHDSGIGSESSGSGTSTDGAGDTSNSNDPPPTPVVVGSVFGSLAGVTLIAFLVLLVLRWKRRKHGSLQLGTGRDLPTPDIPSNSTAAATPGPMSMVRRASSFAVPAALASLTGSTNPKSRPPPPSPGRGPTAGGAGTDRSFVRISGRKLPSVLTSGGNGYEDPHHPLPNSDPFADPQHLSETSFYRDSRGFYGGVGGAGGSRSSASTSASPTHSHTNINNNNGTMPPPPSSPLSETGGGGGGGGGPSPIMRQGPGRIGVTTYAGQGQQPQLQQMLQGPGQHGMVMAIAAGTAFPLPPTTGIGMGRDALGRSHPSRDGSRGSRFTEDV